MGYQEPAVSPADLLRPAGALDLPTTLSADERQPRNCQKSGTSEHTRFDVFARAAFTDLERYSRSHPDHAVAGIWTEETTRL